MRTDRCGPSAFNRNCSGGFASVRSFWISVAVEPIMNSPGGISRSFMLVIFSLPRRFQIDDDGDAEADVGRGVTRSFFIGAARGRAVFWNVIPAAATDAPGAAPWTGWILLGAAAIIAQGVGRPFGGIAVHVKDAPGVRFFLADRLCLVL